MEPDIYLTKPSKKNTSKPGETNSTIKKYTMDDFYKFRQSLKIQIPQSIMDKIKYIYNETLKSKEEYIKSKIINNENVHNTTNYNRKRKNIHELTDEDWEKMRHFKITQKDKKSGIDKLYGDIRSLLNKLTNDTYDEIKTDIINLINSFVNKNENQENISYYDFGIVIEMIFDIVKSNSFYSKLYTNFMCDLFNVNNEFVRWFGDNYDRLISALYDVKTNDIHIGNPEKDYDEFCKINKENEQRRNLAVFFCDIKNKKIDFIETSPNEQYDAFEYLFKYYQLFVDYGSNSETQEKCNEACETFCIIYKNLYEYIKNKDNDLKDRLWHSVCDNLLTMTKMKNAVLRNKYPGITTKTLFKLMDINLNI